MEVAILIAFVRACVKAQTLLEGFPVEVVVGPLIQNGISIRFMDGADQDYNDGNRILTSIRFSAVLSAPCDALTPELVAQWKALDAALDGVRGPATGGQVLFVNRARPYYLAKREDDGRVWQYMGGIYDASVRAA